MSERRPGRDVEGAVRDALKAAGDSYSPKDPDAARARFLRHHRRRSIGVGIGAVAVAGVLLFSVFALPRALFTDGPEPTASEGDRDTSPGITGTVFYFSDGDDILSYGSDGRISPLIHTRAAAETGPAISSDGRYLAFVSGGGNERTVSYLQVGLGAIYLIDGGYAPAFASDGRLAWVDPGGREIIVGRPGGATRLTLDGALAGSGDVATIEWDDPGRTIYFATEDGLLGQVAVEENARAFRLDFPQEPPDQGFAGLASEAASLEAIRVSSSGVTGAVTVDLGKVVPGGEASLFDKIKGLDDLGLDPDSGDLVLEGTAGLDFEADTGWTQGEARSWLVGDTSQLWLVDENEEADALPLRDVTGIAVVPAGIR